MLVYKIFVTIFLILVACSVALATPVMPDPCISFATMDGVNGPETVVLFNLPNGGGSSFAEAQLLNGSQVIDATITLHVLDPLGNGFADFPAEDLWLESVDGGMIPCVGGATADSSTDQFGRTFWSEPLHAGGHSMSPCVVFINGMALCQPPLPLYFNSADMNGDGTVNLVDIGEFSAIFWGVYDFSADFSVDGVLNLSDIGRLAAGNGTSCP